MEVAEYCPPFVPASCGGEISPLWICLGLVDVVIHEHTLSLPEPAVQVVLQMCLLETGLSVCHTDIYRWSRLIKWVLMWMCVGVPTHECVCYFFAGAAGAVTAGLAAGAGAFAGFTRL
jgi:hypothetical protein